MHQHGMLLLNASLVLSDDHSINQHAKFWRPFMIKVLQTLADEPRTVTLILFGKVADNIESLSESKQFKQLRAEHPYNLSFISNHSVLKLFKLLKLLSNKQHPSLQ